MKRSNSTKDLENNYLCIKDFLGHIPSIFEMAENSVYPISLYIKSYGSWYNFLKKMNDINFFQSQYSFLVLKFLQLLEKTKMTKSYKMGLFLVLFNGNKEFKQAYSLDEIAVDFKELYKILPFQSDFQGKKFTNLKEWKIEDYKNLILSNPIHYLINNKNSDFFVFKNNYFIFTDTLYAQLKNNSFLLEEIISRINYRNLYYFKQKNLNIKKLVK